MPALVITGVAKGGFGGGLGIVAMPLLALVVSPADAGAIPLPVLILMDLIGVRTYWRDFDPHALAVMLPRGRRSGSRSAGSRRPAGRSRHAPDRGRDRARVRRPLPARRRPARAGARPGRLLGGICGGIAGFTSTIAHAGSPPAAIYLLPLKLDKTRLVATNVSRFAAIDLLKLVPYGQLGAENLATALLLAPPAAVSMVAGMRLRHRLEPVTFYRLCYAFVALTGLKLVYDGLI